MQKANVQLSIRSTLSKTRDLTEPKDILDITRSIAIPNEVADKRFDDEIELSAGGSTTLDLQSLGDDALGTAISLTSVNVFYIENLGEEDDHILEVGGAASNAWVAIFDDVSDISKVQPTGKKLLVAPDTHGYVVSGTSKNLKVLNPGATAAKFRITIIGS